MSQEFDRRTLLKAAVLVPVFAARKESSRKPFLDQLVEETHWMGKQLEDDIFFRKGLDTTYYNDEEFPSLVTPHERFLIDIQYHQPDKTMGSLSALRIIQLNDSSANTMTETGIVFDLTTDGKSAYVTLFKSEQRKGKVMGGEIAFLHVYSTNPESSFVKKSPHNLLTRSMWEHPRYGLRARTQAMLSRVAFSA